MTSWFNENIFSIVTLAAGLISTMLGAAWWMSALYSRVKQIHERVDEFVDDYKSSQARMWNAIQEIDSRLDDHEVRLTKTEERMK